MNLQQLLQDIEKAVREYYLVARKYPEVTIYVDKQTFHDWIRSNRHCLMQKTWDANIETIGGHKYHLVQNTKEPHIKFYLTKRIDGANVVLDKLLKVK